MGQGQVKVHRSINTKLDEIGTSWLEKNGVRFYTTGIISNYTTETIGENTVVRIPIKENYAVAGYTITFKLETPIKYTANVYSKTNVLLETHNFEYDNADANEEHSILIGRSLPEFFIGSELKIIINRKIKNIDNVKLFGKDFVPPIIPVYLKSETGEINLGNNKTITRDTKYQIDIPIIDTFQIQIPNNKPTNRILVYESSTNKLIHITDWIAKGTTQNVTISYTNNNGVLNVTSSVVPVIKSSYASVGNIPYSGCDDNNKNNCKVILKGYEWNKEPFNPLKINNNSFCRALGSTFRGGQSMYLGNVIDNKCRVREYYDIDGRGYSMGDRLSDKSDFEYLNLLNDSGIIWTNKNNVPSDSKRRVLVQINSWDPNNEVANSICKVNDMIGHIEGDYCLLSNDPYDKRFTYNNFDVLYQAGKEP